MIFYILQMFSYFTDLDTVDHSVYTTPIDLYLLVYAKP